MYQIFSTASINFFQRRFGNTTQSGYTLFSMKFTTFFGIVALCTFFYSNWIFGHFCCNIHFFPNDSSGWKFNRCNDCFDIAKNFILYWRLSLYCVAFQLKWHVNGMSFVTIKSSKKGTGKEVPSILCKY